MATRSTAEFWGSGGADRGDASYSGRGKELDFGGPLSARTELLHAAARPRSAAACDLYRLAAAPDLRGHHGGRPVHPARRDLHHGAELDLRGLRECQFYRGAALWPEDRKSTRLN